MSPPLGTDDDAMEVQNVYAASSNNKSSPSSTTTTTTATTKTSSNGAVASATAASAASADNDVLFSRQLLQMYYSRLFPYSLLYNWLSYGGKNPAVFSRREFSFTIDVNGEEVYIRYQSFAGQNELQQAILKRCPNKIDIGAVFSMAPKDKNSAQTASSASNNAFKPVQRELVFDIDLTDYDEIRKCGCSGAKICPTCWGFMEMAVCVMDKGLREDFGWTHICWFYSGRRGVHAWVCDESARELTDAGRAAVASYFEVNLGTDKNKEVNLPNPLHPMLKRSYEMLEPMFIEQVIPASGHGLLATEENWTGLLDSMPEAASKVRENLTREWSSNSDSSPEEKWEELKKHLAAFIKKTAGNSKQSKTMTAKEKGRVENWPAEVVFRYTYPRLDINVSKMRNHLLKSPFCVHPKTGRVCVPIQPEKMSEFDPFAVPTLPQLMKELDEFEKQNKDDATDDMETDDATTTTTSDGKQQGRKEYWQKTSLKGYFEPFRRAFLEPLQKELRRDARDEAEQAAAASGDF